uniref:Uncharacterized mitochondrial protein AtMg00810-like n=1 Tax=Nicotiana tabacum TaxID=4097 RepID=A0A1S3XS58_TOBAC|nr:PREDICTED: uncharacterized mitochondrial protein AtMg00810-like [Nicotiana tabacum]
MVTLLLPSPVLASWYADFTSPFMGLGRPPTSVYVDDIILIGTDSAEISSLKSFFDAQFKIKDLGSRSYFLGIEVLYSDSRVLLHEKKFIHDLLMEFHCSDVTSVVCPLPLNVKLKAKEGTHLSKPEVYRSLVGNLNFLTNTRPAISFAVQHLSQFMQSPCLPHLEATLHLLKYLKGTADFGVFFNNSLDLSVAAYYDSDWVACPETRGCLSKAVGELTWLHRLVLDLGVSCPSSVPLFCDSQVVIHIAKNSIFYERTKHIKLVCHLVRAKIAEGLINLLHTSSSTQLADIFKRL